MVICLAVPSLGDRSTSVWIVCFVVFALVCRLLNAQTEGDHGYDYEGAYDIDDLEAGDESVLGYEPSFDVPIVNVTVVTGQIAVLPCSIDYLGKYKVAWLDYKSIPLTYEDRRVIDDFRFSVVRPYVKEWNLQIRDIKREDQGQYRCTINTNPVKSKVVMLHVKVPASIIDELSSNDMIVQEGDTVVLVCNVTGVPQPEVRWSRRSAGSKMAEGESKTCTVRSIPGPGIDITGEMIVIQNVSRYCDDIFECIASNGVPPPVSRQMKVTVEFKPEISLPTRRLGQARGRETILECIITAYPQAVTTWSKDGKTIASSSRHRLEAYDEEDNTLVLSLRIHGLEQGDYGEYRCTASNTLGDDTATMQLYEYIEHEDKYRSSSAALMWTSSPSQSIQMRAVSNPRTAAAAAATKIHGYGTPSKNKHSGGFAGRSLASKAHVVTTANHRRWPLLVILTLTWAIVAEL